MTTDNQANDFGWHSAIIMRAGHLSIESFYTKGQAVQHLREWYAGLLDEQDPDDRPDLIAEFGDPASITVERMCDYFAMGEEHLFWCDVVPVEDVLSRISPTLMSTYHEIPHAAIVLAEGTIEAQPCPSYEHALNTLRDRASDWERDASDPDPATATAEQLSQLYGGNEPGMWLGIMPLIKTPEGSAVLVPIDHLPANL